MAVSRRGFLGFLAAVGGSTVAAGKIAVPGSVPEPAPMPEHSRSLSATERLHESLRERVGDDIFNSWFKTLEVESLVLGTVTVSVPVKFLGNWIKRHYAYELSACCGAVFATSHVELVLRQPGACTDSQCRQTIAKLG